MNITLIGWIIIPLSIFFAIRDKQKLLYLTIFFSTFTAASVINIEKTVTGIAPFYFIAGLWIVVEVIEYIKSKKNIKLIIQELKNNKLIKSLILFMSIILVGEIALLFRNGITYTNLNNENAKMIIKFSGSNISQPIYLIFMIVFSILLILKVKEKKEIFNLIKIFSISTIFALIWGLAQFCMYYLNIRYPNEIFNNNIALGQLYFQMVHGIKRVNSIALEPSTFSLNLLFFIPIIFILWLTNKKIVEGKIKSQIILLVVLLISLMISILTTSSTAYIGIFLMVIILSIYILFFSIKDNILFKQKKKMIIFYFIGIGSLILVLILAINIFNIYWGTLLDTFKDMTINKVNLESGNERGNAVAMSINLFKQAPILGVGWGSFRSLDLFTNILANTGIIGIILFFRIIIDVLKKIIIYRKKNEEISLMFFVIILITTLAMLIAIPDLTFGYFWMFIAISYNYCSLEVGDKV